MGPIALSELNFSIRYSSEKGSGNKKIENWKNLSPNGWKLIHILHFEPTLSDAIFVFFKSYFCLVISLSPPFGPPKLYYNSRGHPFTISESCPPASSMLAWVKFHRISFCCFVMLLSFILPSWNLFWLQWPGASPLHFWEIFSTLSHAIVYIRFPKVSSPLVLLQNHVPPPFSSPLNIVFITMTGAFPFANFERSPAP